MMIMIWASAVILITDLVIDLNIKKLIAWSIKFPKAHGGIFKFGNAAKILEIAYCNPNHSKNIFD